MADKLAPSLGEIWRTTQPDGKINLLALIFRYRWREKTVSRRTGATCPEAVEAAARRGAFLRQHCRQRGKRYPACPHGAGRKCPMKRSFARRWKSPRRCDPQLGEESKVYARWSRHRRTGYRCSCPRRVPLSRSRRAMNPGSVFWPVSVPTTAVRHGATSGKSDGQKRWWIISAERIKGGQATDATLAYGGNPHLFPYKHNEGQFQVTVPLKNATLPFQPDWPGQPA